MKITFVDLGSPPRVEINEPLGIESIFGNLFSRFEENIEGNIYISSVTTATIEELLKCDLIGFSTNIGSYSILEKYLSNLIQSKSLESLPVILLGGSIATFASRDLLKKYPFVICVRGEGENAVKSIVDILMKYSNNAFQIFPNRELARIPNLVFLNHDGNIVETETLVENLGSLHLPSRLTIDKVIKHMGVVRAETSRGCPFGKCHFCAVGSKYGNSLWRPIPIDRVIQDFRSVSSSGARSVYISDDDFLGTSLERINSLCDSIILEKAQKRINPNMNFFVSTQVNSILGEKLGGVTKSIKTLKKMRNAGFREIFIGIESGSREQMHRYGKGTTIKKSIQAINIIQSAGIDVDIGFIMFDKFMSLSQLQENVQFLRSAALFSHDANLLKTLRFQPQTRLSDDLLKAGIITDNLLDINNLEYPYEFEDKKIRLAYLAYQEWANPMKTLYYEIQAAYRGEVPSENIRMKLKKVLGSLREIDMKFLESIISLITISQSFSNINLVSIKINLTTQRQKLVIKAKEYLEEYHGTSLPYEI